VVAAVKQGCAAIALMGVGNFEQPHLVARSGVDAGRLVLTDPLGLSPPDLSHSLYGVPPTPALFLGRAGDVDAVKMRLGIVSKPRQTARARRIVAVRGWPGVGKTSIATVIARDPDTNVAFPDGVLWVSLGEAPNLLAELVTCGRYLGAEDVLRTATLKDAIARLRVHLSEKRMVLIVDDVWTLEDVLPFLHATPERGALLITTRLPAVAERVASGEDGAYHLSVLDRYSAIELLRRLVPSLVEERPEASTALVDSLEYLPLAVHVAGRLLASEYRNGWGVDDLLAELSAGADRILASQVPLDGTEPGTHAIPTVTILLERSTTRLDAETRERFAFLAAFAPKPATFDLQAAGAVWNVSDPRPTIRQLVDRGLLEPVGSERFQIHALLIAHARSLGEK
jgi:hypothetical protein